MILSEVAGSLIGQIGPYSFDVHSTLRLVLIFPSKAILDSVKRNTSIIGGLSL